MRKLATPNGGSITPGLFLPEEPTLWVPGATFKRLWDSVKEHIAFMGAMTDYEEQQYLNHRYKGAAQTSIATWYVALFTATPGEASGGTEVSGGSYARQGIANANFSAPSVSEPTTIDNSLLITYPTASASWGTITSASIDDAVSAGNKALFGNLTASKVVDSGDTFKFNIGTLDLGVG